MLGIGAIIGAGFFVLTGNAAAKHAGPAVALSFVLGGIVCAFAGLCYAEMASTVPVAGSAYTYAYATMGEFIAWLIGWDLILEYAVGATTVAIGWSGYVVSFLGKTLGIHIPPALTFSAVARHADDQHRRRRRRQAPPGARLDAAGRASRTCSPRTRSIPRPSPRSPRSSTCRPC